MIRVVPVRTAVRTNRVSPACVVDWPSTRAEGPLTPVIRNDSRFGYGLLSRTGSRTPIRTFAVQEVKGSPVVLTMGQAAEAGGGGCPVPGSTVEAA